MDVLELLEGMEVDLLDLVELLGLVDLELVVLLVRDGGGANRGGLSMITVAGIVP